MDALTQTLQQGIDLLLGTWPLRIVLLLLLAVALDALQRRALYRLARRAKRGENTWSEAVLRALPAPFSLLIWVCAASWAMRIGDRQMGWGLAGFVLPLAGVGVIAAFAWFGLRVTRNVKQNLIARAQARGDQLDTTTVDAVTKLVVVCIIILAVIFALQNFGFSISGLLAFGGLGALVIGMAAQGFLANFFGGWMIYLTRPFSVGDWINSPDREIEGTVEQIGWFQTRIRAFDMRPLYVPNATFSTVVLANPSRMTHRLLYETIGVRHSDLSSLGGIVTDVEQYLRSHEDLDQNQSVMAYFDQLTPNALNFFIYCFTRSIAWMDFQRVKQDVLFRIAGIIESHGAEIGQPVARVQLSGELPQEIRRQARTEGSRAERDDRG